MTAEPTPASELVVQRRRRRAGGDTRRARQRDDRRRQALGARATVPPSSSACAANASPAPDSRSNESWPSSSDAAGLDDDDPDETARDDRRAASRLPPSVAVVAEPVRDRIGRALDEHERMWTEIDPALASPLQAIRQLVLSGGKRLRPAFCHWGFRAAGGAADDPARGRRRRRVRATARVRADPRRRDGRLGPATRRAHRARCVRRRSTSGAGGGARPAGSATASRSSPATWPRSWPTNCSPARPTTPLPCGTSCVSR